MSHSLILKAFLYTVRRLYKSVAPNDPKPVATTIKLHSSTIDSLCLMIEDTTAKSSFQSQNWQCKVAFCSIGANALVAGTVAIGSVLYTNPNEPAKPTREMKELQRDVEVLVGKVENLTEKVNQMEARKFSPPYYHNYLSWNIHLGHYIPASEPLSSMTVD